MLSHLSPTRSYRIFVIDDGISLKNRMRVERMISEFSDIDIEFAWVPAAGSASAGMVYGGHLTAATYLRLQIPERLPPDVSRVLYLDTDLLVTRDVGELWDSVDEMNAPLMAVPDFLLATVSTPGGVANYRERGLPADAPYLNAGVMLLDLRRWRADDLTGRIRHYLADSGDVISLADQEGINAVLAEHWEQLEACWNIQTTAYDRLACENARGADFAADCDALINDGGIYHFTGRWKPWHLECIHPLKGLWHRQLSLTGWNDPVAISGEPRTDKQGTLDRTAQGKADKRVTRAEIAIQLCGEGALADAHSLAEMFDAGNVPPPIFWLVENGLDVAEEGEEPVGQVVRTRNAFPVSSWLRFKDALADWELKAPSDLLVIVAGDASVDPGATRQLAQLMREEEQAGIGLLGPVTGGQAGASGSVCTGMEFARQLADGLLCQLEGTTIAIRRDALTQALAQDPDLDRFARHGTQWAAMALALEIAERSAVAVAPFGQAPGSESARLSYDPLPGVDEIGALGLRIEAATRLLEGDPVDTGDVLAQLRELNNERSAVVRHLVPVTGPSFDDRRLEWGNQIIRLVPAGASFILVGSDHWPGAGYRGRHATPLVSRNDVDWGEPEDDAQAIAELEARIAEGATHLVITLNAFWWDDYLPGFTGHVAATYRCTHQDGRIRVYDLRTGPANNE